MNASVNVGDTAETRKSSEQENSRVTLKALEPVPSDFVLEVHLADGWSDIVTVDPLLGRHVLEPDLGAVRKEDGLGQGHVERHDRRGRRNVEDLEVVVEVSVGVEGDLLLCENVDHVSGLSQSLDEARRTERTLRTARVVVQVRVKVATLRVEMSEGDRAPISDLCRTREVKPVSCCREAVEQEGQSNDARAKVSSIPCPFRVC